MILLIYLSKNLFIKEHTTFKLYTLSNHCNLVELLLLESALKC